ncbi:MAG: hypothetical protein AABX05_00045 [Nanoarchaeota archaeon]
MQSAFLKSYLYIALSFGILGFFDSVLSLLSITSSWYSYALAGLTLLFFLFNITSVIIFSYQGSERAAFVLPIYHLVSYTLFTLLMVLYLFFQITLPLDTPLLILSFMMSLFEISFSAYLLKRWYFSPQQ